MKTLVIALSTLFAVGASGVASAATLYTASMLVAGTDDFDCELVNVSDSPLMVQIQIINGFGNVLVDSTERQVGAGFVSNVVINNPVAFLYCKFVVKGGKNKVRAAAHRTAALGSSLLNSLPAY